MENEDAIPRPGDPLIAVILQDLDPLSVAELDKRVATLEAEIARTKAKRDRAVNDRASAHSLFRT